MSFSFHAPKSGLLGLLVAASFPALAQTAPTLKEIVVSANRTEQPIADVVADVSLIDRDEIEKSGASAIADLLARTPGIQFVRNGGPGATTSLMIRGADTRFTAVYVDGVRIDSQSTGGATWEAIPVSQIDHVEILRGPAAAIYGSDAVGGVIQIFTRKGEGGFKPFIGIGIGSYNMRKMDAGFSGAEGIFDYSIGLSKEKSDGFNAKSNGNPDKDGYSSYSGNARFGLQINPSHRLDVTTLKSHINSQYDSSAKLDDHSVHDLETLGLTWQAKWTDVFSTRAMVTQGKDHYDTYPSLYVTETTLRNYVWQNEFRQGSHLATATLERREDDLQNSSTTPSSPKRSQNALALGYEFREKKHTLQLNARHDVDSEFGDKSTGGAAYAYDIAPAWKATVSTGTAFRAPTLYQRFSKSGNASLSPETSVNQEAGLRYASQGTAFGIVVYKNRIDNLISYVSGATGCADTLGCYQSTKHAQLEGVTLSASTTVRSVKIGASFDWLDPKDKETGKDLIRRARQSATLSVEAPMAGWMLGSEVQAYGKRFDNAANTTVLGGYSLINLYATRKMGRDYSLLARLNNLADHDYQLANTYNTPGRSVFVGMRWEPQ